MTITHFLKEQTFDYLTILTKYQVVRKKKKHTQKTDIFIYSDSKLERHSDYSINE